MFDWAGKRERGCDDYAVVGNVGIWLLCEQSAVRQGRKHEVLPTNGDK